MKVAKGVCLAIASVVLADSVRAQTVDTVRFKAVANYDGRFARARPAGSPDSAWTTGAFRQLGAVVELDVAKGIPMTVPHGQPVDIEVMVGKRRVKGALIGALIGGAGYAYAATHCSHRRPDGCSFVILDLPVFVGLGAGFGALLGSDVPRWEAVWRP